MALFKFTRAILNGEKIDVYNHGEMFRDFTYVDDLVNGIFLLINTVPASSSKADENYQSNDNLSPVAPFRVVNIGNSKSEKLTDFIDVIEKSLGIPAIKNFMPIQAGDVPATWADTSLLEDLTGYQPKTNLEDGVQRFVRWYRDFYRI